MEVLQEAMKARMKQSMIDVLRATDIIATDPDGSVTIRLDQQEAGAMADGIITAITPEIEALVAAAERAGRQKETREEWLRPLITTEEGDDPRVRRK